MVDSPEKRLIAVRGFKYGELLLLLLLLFFFFFGGGGGGVWGVGSTETLKTQTDTHTVLSSEFS